MKSWEQKTTLRVFKSHFGFNKLYTNRLGKDMVAVVQNITTEYWKLNLVRLKIENTANFSTLFSIAQLL